MAGKGETVKYIIDADTSGFSRGMAEAAIEADVAGKKIDGSLSNTSKKAENNFKDMRNSAKTTAGTIRAFSISMSSIRTSAIVLGITILSGAILELAGAAVAASSTATILVPLLAQGGAAALTFKTGLSGLSSAFAAIQKNDPVAFKQALAALGPAATQVAYAFGGLNKAFNSIKLNTQQALLAGVGNELLHLGALILPTVNAGFQTIGRAMNGAFNQAAQLMSSPVFSGLLATIFQDTAHNIDILSGGLAPLLSIFTNLYLITRPYVSLLAQLSVNALKTLSAYLSSARGQAGLNLAIQEGLVAIGQLGNLAGAVFRFLQALFATSVNSGINLITTLTGIVQGMTDWINSAQGQQSLISLFQFTSVALQTVAKVGGMALQAFFNILGVLNNLAPELQNVIVGIVGVALAIIPTAGYFIALAGAAKQVGVVIFNLAEQLGVVFAELGAVASIALVVGGGLIVLGSIIGGPLGGALIILGAAIVAYIGLSYLLAQASATGAASFWAQSYAAYEATFAEAELSSMNGLVASTMLAVAGAGLDAGAGLGFAATAAEVLQAALIPLLILAAGVVVLLSMLGLFSNAGKQAQGASTGLGTSLGGLQKQMKGLGATTSKTANMGLAPLADNLNNVGNAANAAQGSLASFDKMNVLTASPSAGAGIPNIPALPDVGGLGGGAAGMPTLDTSAFDKSLADMQKNFDGLKKNLAAGVPNPFDAIGKWIDAHPWIALAAFAAIILLVAAAFIVFDVATLPISVTLGLIVLAVIAIIAIIILLVQNWSTVWGFIQTIVADVGSFIMTLFTTVGNFIMGVLTAIGNFFTTIFQAIGVVVMLYINIYIAAFQLAWNAIVAIWNVLVSFFTGIFNGVSAAVSWLINGIINYFKLAWLGVQIIWAVVVAWFQGVWNGIVGVFSGVVSWFGGIFNGAWNAIKSAFGAVGGFFANIWNTIVSIFGGVGTAVGNAISGAFKGVVNAVIDTVANTVNTVIDLINGAIKLIDKIPGVNIGTMPRVSLPHLAKGGVVSKPTLAMFGEAGQEAVMPLENNTGWIDKLASKINSANGSGDGTPINLTVQIGEDKIATKVINLINEKTQMSGRNSILV